MATPLPFTAPPPPPDSSQPTPGQASRLAASLAAKQGAKIGPAKSQPVIASPGTKGGRKSIAEESAAFLQSRGLHAVPIGASDGLVGPPPVPQYVVTPEFVGEVTEKLLQGVEAWRVRQVALRVQTICGDKVLAKEFADSAAAPPGCIQTVSKSMMEISRKYPMVLQWAPELAGLAALGTWFAKDSQIMRRLDELEARMRKQFERASAAPQSPATPPPVPVAAGNPKP